MAQDECGENDTPRARSWPDLCAANHSRTIAHRNARKLSPEPSARRCTTSANSGDFVFTGLEACATLRRQAKI